MKLAWLMERYLESCTVGSDGKMHAPSYLHMGIEVHKQFIKYIWNNHPDEPRATCLFQSCVIILDLKIDPKAVKFVKAGDADSFQIPEDQLCSQ